MQEQATTRQSKKRFEVKGFQDRRGQKTRINTLLHFLLPSLSVHRRAQLRMQFETEVLNKTVFPITC